MPQSLERGETLHENLKLCYQAATTSLRIGPMIRRLPLLLCLLALACSPGPAPADQLDLTVTPQPLDPEDPSRTSIGALAWRGTLELASDHPHFGGLSGLLLEPDGAGLLAVSDDGHWVSARIRLDDRGFLIGLEDAEIDVLHDPDNRPVTGKRAGDAEALTRLGDGTSLVAFEQEHRIWRYPAGPGGLGQAAQAFPPPPGVDRLKGNNGLEALTKLPDDRLLALTEDDGDTPTIPGFLWQDGQWSDIALVRRRPYLPTGATVLPSGDVLLLERRFSLLGGLGITIRRIPLAEIRPGATLDGEILAELSPPMIYDNMEGIAAQPEPGGGVRIYVISDDNFNVAQRTLLMSFWLEAE